MTEKCLGHRLNVVVLYSKLLARLPHDGCDLTIVRLDHAREQVVRSLVVQSSREHGPEPAIGSVVLCGSNFKLCPGVWESIHAMGAAQPLLNFAVNAHKGRSYGIYFCP